MERSDERIGHLVTRRCNQPSFRRMSQYCRVDRKQEMWACAHIPWARIRLIAKDFDYFIVIHRGAKPHKCYNWIILFAFVFLLHKINIMLTKEAIKKTIDTLPDQFTIEEVIEELILMDKIEQGLNDVKEGNVFTTEEAKQRLKKWLK